MVHALHAHSESALQCNGEERTENSDVRMGSEIAGTWSATSGCGTQGALHTQTSAKLGQCWRTGEVRVRAGTLPAKR